MSVNFKLWIYLKRPHHLIRMFASFIAFVLGFYTFVLAGFDSPRLYYAVFDIWAEIICGAWLLMWDQPSTTPRRTQMFSAWTAKMKRRVRGLVGVRLKGTITWQRFVIKGTSKKNNKVRLSFSTHFFHFSFFATFAFLFFFVAFLPTTFLSFISFLIFF